MTNYDFASDSSFCIRHSSFPSGRVLVLGIGNRMRGDDAIGSVVAERLAHKGKIPALDCGEMPDNYVGRVWELAPAELIFVDACDFGGEPGEVRVFEEADLERLANAPLSTHQMPLPMLIGLIRMKPDVARRVRLVGIQPVQIEYFREEMSEPVRAAVSKVMALVRRLADRREALGDRR
jgi:hydrogenase 3 maturation protease